MTGPAAHEARLRAAALQEQIGAMVQVYAPEAVIVDTAALERLTADLAASRAQLEQMREAITHVVNDSPGTPNSVKKYLARALAAVADPEAVSRG